LDTRLNNDWVDIVPKEMIFTVHSDGILHIHKSSGEHSYQSLCLEYPEGTKERKVRHFILKDLIEFHVIHLMLLYNNYYSVFKFKSGKT
jgi:hypothetical protein